VFKVVLPFIEFAETFKEFTPKINRLCAPRVQKALFNVGFQI